MITEFLSFTTRAPYKRKTHVRLWVNNGLRGTSGLTSCGMIGGSGACRSKHKPVSGRTRV